MLAQDQIDLVFNCLQLVYHLTATRPRIFEQVFLMDVGKGIMPRDIISDGTLHGEKNPRNTIIETGLDCRYCSMTDCWWPSNALLSTRRSFWQRRGAASIPGELHSAAPAELSSYECDRAIYLILIGRLLPGSCDFALTFAALRTVLWNGQTVPAADKTSECDACALVLTRSGSGRIL